MKTDKTEVSCHLIYRRCTSITENVNNNLQTYFNYRKCKQQTFYSEDTFIYLRKAMDS